jgi:hypothetical protein
MKTKLQIALLAVVLGFVAGCASSPKPKAVHERGWIGSDFQPASHELRPKGERGAVYVRQVFDNTPSAQAGLQPADLILALDGEPVRHLRDFRTRVDMAKPGQILKVTAWRDGQRVETPVTVGRERYEQWHSFQFGFGLSSHLDILPDPNFSLLPVASFKRETCRVELSSPESILKRHARKTADDDSAGLPSKEGWQAWLVVFGLGGHKKIISQESVVPLRAQR